MLRSITRFIVWFSLTGALACAFAHAQKAPPSYRVIVHPGNAAGAVDRSLLADAFLKKVTRWPNGDVIRPIDQVASSIARRNFSDDVLKRSIAAVKNYWQQAIFSGRDTPPAELDSDDAVIEFVIKHPGAVGYVSAGANLREAKPIAVR